MPNVTLILPTYCPTKEVSAHLKRCFSLLSKNTEDEQYSLVVVENGSTDFFSLVQAEVEAGGFRFTKMSGDCYVHTPYPLGYARAVNMGLKLARTEFVCILNNDVFVPPGWLTQMLADFASIKRCGILAPQERSANPGITYDDHWWSLVLARRSLFDEVGLLDEEHLNARYADQDMSFRVRKAGYQICRTGNVIVEHDESSTYRHLKNTAIEDAERAVMMERWGYCEFPGGMKSA